MNYTEMTLEELYAEVRHLEDTVWLKHGRMGAIELSFIEEAIDDVLDEIAKRNAQGDK